MPILLNADLFELVRVVSVPQAKTAGLAGSVRTAVERAVWQQNGSLTVLVLALNNNMLLLRLWDTSSGKQPTVKVLPWYECPSARIRAMSLSPAAEWLVCVCGDQNIYLVPCYSLLTGEKPKVSKWSLKDITLIKHTEKQGVVTCAAWWQTRNSRQILIMGSQSGRVIFIDLVLKQEVWSVQVPSSVTSIELLQMTTVTATYLLICVDEGQTWRMVLEAPSEVPVSSGNVSLSADEAPTEFVSCLDEEKPAERHYPTELKLLHIDVKLSSQKKKGHLFMAVHDLITQRFELWNPDVDLQDQALFTYKLLRRASMLQFTEIVTFVVCQQDKQPCSLHVLSSQLAASVPATNEPPQEEPSSSESVLQSFSLPLDEDLLGVYLCHHPARLNNGSGGLEKDQITRSVLDSCLVVTTQGVYHCRQKVSPEDIFLEMATQCNTFDATDKLGIALQLDICGLYQIAGESRLAKSDYGHAMDLFSLANCPPVKLIKMFIEKGRMRDIMSYLEMVLSEQGSQFPGDPKVLADFLLHCYVHQILETRPEKEAHAKLVEKLSQFVNDNFAYDDQSAMKFLARNGLTEMALQVAKARAKVTEATDLLVKQGTLQLGSRHTAMLTSSDHALTVATCYDGVLVRCMQPQDLVQFILSQPDLIPHCLTHLSSVLPKLSQQSILCVIRFFDPSRSAIRSLLSQAAGGRSRRYSTGSMMSLSSAALNEAQESYVDPKMDEYIELFLCSILALRMKRMKEPPIDCSFVLPTIDREIAAVSAQSIGELCRCPMTPTAVVDIVPLSCGQSHAAAVVQGDVYTWGQAQSGRLGHGDIIAEGRSTPLRVEILHMMNILVLSVSCGAEHTLALCTEGVYSWGSGTYGQLGLGDTGPRTRPALVAELSGKCCTAVTCGQYHSLALTQDQRVWSWGWNVHSQLGQGGIEDSLIPTHVKVLDRHEVTKIIAGNYHTAVLTSKGNVLTFGNGSQGQLGLGNILKTAVPRVIRGLQDVFLLGCGLFHTVAVTNDQVLFMWGRRLQPDPRVDRSRSRGDHSRLIRRQRIAYHSMIPQRVVCALDSKISQISCGGCHCQLLTETGRVYSWGANDYGQLGYETKQEVTLLQPRPKLVVSLGNRIQHIACGDQFSAAMDIDGYVWVWGREDLGQLGFELKDVSGFDGFKFTCQPSLLKGLSVGRSRRDTLPETEEEEGDLSSDDLSESGSVLEPDWDELPPFYKQDPPQLAYDKGALKEALRSLSGIYRSHIIVRYLTAWQDWESVAFLHELKRNWPQCLKYQLKVAMPLSSGSDDETMENTACQAITFCTEQVAGEGNAFDVDDIAMQLLEQICRFWYEQKLKIRSLENVLSNHFAVYGSSLCQLCLSIRNTEEKEQGDGSLWSVTKSFSTKFQMKALASVTVKISERHGYAICKQISTTLSAEDESACAESGSEDNAKVIASGLTVEDERLWNEILNNLGKDLNKRAHVLLQGLPEDVDSDTDETEKQQSGVDIVCFTTGKAYSRKTFEQVVLPRFRQQLKQMSNETPSANKSLLDHYQHSPLIALASPDALLDALR